MPERSATGRVEDPGTAASTAFALSLGDGEWRYRLLADAAAALDESLDLEPRLQAFVEVVVRSLSDWAVVDLLDDAATTRRVAVAARPELRDQVGILQDYPTDPNGSGPGGRALQAGRPFLLAEVDDAYIGHVARHPTHAAVLRRLRARTVMAVPLVGRQRTLGVMILARGPNGPLFGEHDLELAADLGRRAALSVEIAELYLQEHHARERAERAGARTAQLQSLTSLLVGATSQDEVAGFLRDHALAALGSGEVALMVRRAGELDGLMALLKPTTTTIEAWLRHTASTGEARWIDELAGDGAPEPSSSACFVPFAVDGRVLGAMGLVFSPRRTFDGDDIAFITAHADLCAGALDRIALTESRERLVEHLREERSRFRLIIDTVGEAIIVFDPETHRIGEVNRGAEELLGRPRAALLELTIDELLRPDDAERLLHVVGELRAGPQGATTITLEYPGPGDRSVAVDVVVQSVDLREGGHGIVAIARDIRERTDTQIRLQRLAEAEHARAAEMNAVIRAIGEAVVVCGADGTITLTNPAAELLFPGSRDDTYADILGQMHDPDGLAPRLGTAGGPIELPTKADPDRWVEITTYPVGGEAATGTTVGTTVGTIVVMRDVTQARSRELVRETFIGVLSHELRTPLTIIFGGAKLLARPDSTLDEETRQGIFHDVYDEAERLQRLVEDVIALNRFAEGTGEVSWEPVLIQRVVPRVVSSEEARWPEATFRLEVEVALPTVRADPTFVEQVLRNLLSNAAKYGGVGSMVRVTAQAGDGEVVVRVLDDGPGFPAMETERLFELFYRSPGTATTAPGAGIGLFVCARLIAAMGGRIWAKSRPEGGAEFGFALMEFTDTDE